MYNSKDNFKKANDLSKKDKGKTAPALWKISEALKKHHEQNKKALKNVNMK